MRKIVDAIIKGLTGLPTTYERGLLEEWYAGNIRFDDGARCRSFSVYVSFDNWIIRHCVEGTNVKEEQIIHFMRSKGHRTVNYNGTAYYVGLTDGR